MKNETAPVQQEKIVETGHPKTKLQKFYLEFRDVAGDVRQYQREALDGNGLREWELPFDITQILSDDFKVRLHSDREFQEIDDHLHFCYIAGVATNVPDQTKREYDRVRDRSALLKYLDTSFPSTKNKPFPSMKYEDVTERDMFGYAAIQSNKLAPENYQQGGIWGMHGLRKFQITVTGLPAESSDCKQRANLYWYAVDSSPIAPIFEEEIRCPKDTPSNAPERIYTVYVNTNRLGRMVEDMKTNHPIFEGRFELHNSTISTKTIYTFPINLMVHDTHFENGKNELLDGGIVSIDFGTSSTCAAIRTQGRPTLLTLSGEHKRVGEGDNAYENPTNLMIYNWEELYEQWKRENGDCPFVRTMLEDFEKEVADYDSGYTVDDEYKEVDSEDGSRKMAAIMTQLKMIPYWLQEGIEKKFRAYGGKRPRVTLTDDIHAEDEKTFNPIAFYGYLLGRAINNPLNQHFYGRYQISYPVKFKPEVRDKIRESLEYGIKRSLPKPVRNATRKNGTPVVSVQMEYSEPEAAVGAIIGHQLTLQEGERAKLFAIYDLGGGTMDFAFGIYRRTTEEEEEDFDGELAITLLGIDGDENVGGEKLIHQLAYEIYLANQDLMNENRVKFVMPATVTLKPDDPYNLLDRKGDEIADANVNILKENVARPLFVSTEDTDNKLKDKEQEIFGDHGMTVEDATHVKLAFRTEDGEQTEDLLLKVEGTDDSLQEAIEKTVVAFKNSMERTFREKQDVLREFGIPEFRMQDVHIFLGGNASRQRYVQDSMKTILFGEAEQAAGMERPIQRIGDEGKNIQGLSRAYEVNVKTAVAFGQLNLGVYLRDDRTTKDQGKPPFLFNVGYIDSATGKFQLVIPKNSTSQEWQRANRIDAVTSQTNLVYTSSPVPQSMSQEEEDDLKRGLIPLQFDVSEYLDEIEEKKRTIYLRVFDGDHIEFRISSRKEAPQNEDDPKKEMTIKLKDNA